MRKVVDFQVPWKKVLQGSCCQFEKPFFLGRTTVYFAGPEPLPWAFFADERGRLTRLDGFELGDLERLCGDFDEPCRRGLCCCRFERLCLPGLLEKETFLCRSLATG